MKLLFLALSYYFVYCEAQKLETCDLAKELNDVENFPKDKLAYWVCLAEHASGGDPTVVHISPEGMHHYGLFQLPQRTCEVGRNGGDCEVACESLANDGVKASTKCALKIFEAGGFYDWLEPNQTCQDIDGVKQKLTEIMASRSTEERILRWLEEEDTDDGDIFLFAPIINKISI